MSNIVFIELAVSKPQTKTIDIPIKTTVVAPTKLTCTGTINESLSGQTSPQTAAKTSDTAIQSIYQGQSIAINGNTPITLTCR